MSRRSEGRRDPLSRLGGFPYWRVVQPHNPCTACGAGDASRMLLIMGEPTWLVAGLMRLGIEEPVAYDMAEMMWESKGGAVEHEPGWRTFGVRLCRACAERITPPVKVYSAARFERGEYKGRPMHGWIQSPVEEES